MTVGFPGFVLKAEMRPVRNRGSMFVFNSLELPATIKAIHRQGARGKYRGPSTKRIRVSRIPRKITKNVFPVTKSGNTGLLRSIFQMGVPVSGKNLFASNIAGLPTWYTIRASRHGYIARRKEIDFLVAMNAETGKEDALSLRPGAACVYDEPLKLSELRTDVTFYPVPFDKLVAQVCPEAKLRRLVKNMIYVGVVDAILEIDLAESEKALLKQFATKKKAAEMNTAAVRAGYDYAKATSTKQDPFAIETMTENQGRLIIHGNAAAAIGCMFAGVTAVTWYPITPSSSLVEQLIDYLKEYRIGPDGKATYAVVQAEDEL